MSSQSFAAWSAAGATETSGGSLAPLLAGARARGMADALDLLGLAAILIDAHGYALHVNLRAQLCFGPHIGLRDGRLELRDASGEAGMATALEEALREEHGEARGELLIRRGAGLPDLVVRILPIKDHGEDPVQLLKAIVILEEAGAPSMAEKLGAAGLN
jgi:hypothetical protein